MKTIAALLVTLTLAGTASAAVKLPPYEEVKLPNGATLLLMERHDVPLVAITARLRGGALADPAGKEGIADLTAALLLKGAGSRDARAFAEAVDSVGANLSVEADRESIEISSDFMARDTDLVLGLLADLLRRPTLPEEEFTKERTLAIESLAAAKDSDPRALIPLYFDAALFGGHPYARPAEGSERSLGGLTIADARRFYESHFGGDRLILAAVGDFKAAEMEAKLRRAFGDWKKAPAAAPKAGAPARVTGRRVLLVDKPGATQTYFMIGNAGSSRLDADLAAADVVNTLFGGRFTSMLNDELRIRSGLTYGARSAMTRYAHPGPLAISTYTRTEATAEATDMALAILKRLHEEGISPAALDSGRNYILGQFPPRLETPRQLAARLSEIALYGLGRDDVDRYGERVAAVTREEAAKTIRRLYPSLDDLVFVFVGDAETIRETVAKYGNVTEMKITDEEFGPR